MKKCVSSESLEKKCSLAKKTVRRKLCILTTLLRAIIDILCIYSANLHPNQEDVGFISANTEIFAKINKGKCFLQKKEEITLHSFVCTSLGYYRQNYHTGSVKLAFSVTEKYTYP